MSDPSDVGLQSNFDNAKLWEEEESTVKSNSKEKKEKQPSPQTTLQGSKTKKKEEESKSSKQKLGKKSESANSLEDNKNDHFLAPDKRTVSLGRGFSKKSTLRDTNSANGKRPWIKHRTIEKVIPFINFTVPPRSIPQWVIVEPSAKFCHAIWEYFYDIDSVKVVCSSGALPTQSAAAPAQNLPDTFVFFGNVYGCQEPFDKSWKELDSYFGSSILGKIKDHVKTKFYGELPLYTSFVIPTGHPIVKHLVYTGVGLTKKPDSLFAYAALYSALCCMQTYNSANANAIQLFVTKGYPVIDGDEEAARQMYLAWLSFCYPPDISLQYKDAKEQTLSITDKITIEERKSLFVDQVAKGEIEKRGFIDSDCVELLFGLFLEADKYTDYFDDDMDAGKISKAAGKALTAYAFPTEFVPGLADQVLSRPGSLPAVLEMIKQGSVKVHREIDPSELKIGEQIAIGAAGKVFKAVYNGEEVAVKVLGEDMLNFSLDEFKREVAIMSIMKHENLIIFYGACTKSDKLMIVTKLMKGGNLHDLVTKEDLPLAVRIKIATEIAKGMAFLHSRDVIHRDLKSLNILLDDYYNVKIIDFGTSRVMDKDKLMTHAIGTVSYMAPEIFNNEKYTEKADVYSFGMVLWEIFARKTPFSDLNSWNIPVAVTKGDRPAIAKEWPSPITKLMKSCWEQKPAKRPPFSEILALLTKIQTALTEGTFKE